MGPAVRWTMRRLATLFPIMALALGACVGDIG